MYVTDRACLSIARTIPLALPDASEAAARLRNGCDPVRGLTLPDGSRIVMRLPFHPDPWFPGRPLHLVPRRTGAALFTRGHRRVSPVEIELAPWSDGVTELVLRPAVRSPYSWGARRLDRWFRQAHAAADLLRGEILAAAAAPAEPVAAPMEPIDLTVTNRERIAV